MTNHWVDIKNANVVMVMGGNAAEAHPVGFRWAMEAKNNNDATLIVVDPRFTRTASVADIYAPIRSGTDITFLSGVLRYLIENNKINAEYVKHYRSEEHTSELQSRFDLVCRLLLEKKKSKRRRATDTHTR